MKSEILSEIKRVKEIMGITPQIISEQLALLKAIAKSGKAELRAELKNYLKTYANAMGVSVDDALEAFEKDYSEALLKNSDDEINKVFDDYFSVISKDYADDLIGIYARTAPLEFGREVVGVELGKQNIPLYDKFMNPATKITEKNLDAAERFLDNIKWRSDNIYPVTSAEQLAKGALDDFAETIEKKIDEFKNPAAKASTSLDDIYDSLVLRGSQKNPPVKFPSKEKITEAESKLKQNFNSPADAIKYYEGAYGSTKGYAETMEEVGKNAKATGKAVSPFLKGLGWGGAALIIAGIVSYNLFVTSKSDAEDQLNELVSRCTKLTGKATTQSDWGRLFSQYKVVVLYNNTLVTAVKEDDWKLNIGGAVIPFNCADEKLGVGDLTKLLTGGGDIKEYTQTLEEFKKFLTDNGLSADNATNDTEVSGFWKANGKDYVYDSTTKTFKEE